MQQQLIDSFGRQMDYVRLAVTDRCNLRCQYCMPAHGIEIAPRADLLTVQMQTSTRPAAGSLANHIQISYSQPARQAGSQ